MRRNHSAPPFVEALARDLRYAVRALAKSPGYAVATVLTFALAIGVNTAAFSVVNALVLRPLPVGGSDRLAVIATRRADGPLRGVSFPDLQDYRAATPDIFEDIAGYSVGFIGLTPQGRAPARVLVTWVTANYFALLGITPATGRLIGGAEADPGQATCVAVLGYSTWQRRFDGDAAVASTAAGTWAGGRAARINGTPCTIAGVAPPDFHGTFAFSDTEVYLPFNWDGGAALDRRDARSLHALARLRPGVTLARAQAAMDVVAARLQREHPDEDGAVRIEVVAERFARPEEDQARTTARGATLLLALVGLVLAVAALNMTNLQLARAATRRKELAIRTALGAGRGRLVRQLLTETFVLAAAGGAAGVTLSAWTVRGLARLRLPGDLPVRFDFHVDGRVAAYAAVLTLMTGLIAGLIPAVRASRADPDRALRDGGQGSRSMTGVHHVHRVLVVTQIATCFVLLAAAGLFVRSLGRAERADLGFTPGGVLNVQMDAAQLGYSEPRGRVAFDDIERRVRELPGVEDLSYAVTVPMGYVSISAPLDVEGRPAAGTLRPIAEKNSVGPRYFSTLRIPVVRGRTFAAGDAVRARLVAIVNRRFADLCWPDRDPIGRRFSDSGPAGPWLEVVGVTATGKYRSLFEDPLPAFYVPIAQDYSALRVLHVRTADDGVDALAPLVERTIHEHEPDLTLYDVQSMTRALGSGRGLFLVRMAATFTAIFGAIALALAAIGLYAVISYAARQRTHEMGVRMALGATGADITRLVLWSGLPLVALGLTAGLAAAVAASPVLGRFLFGVPARDPYTFAAVAPVIAAIALIGCAVPARRAARADPLVALRRE